jgi:5-methylcytosine-specific restriction endonuclease McrA
MKTKCENCSSLNIKKYGSGRFCSSKCARAFSTKNKRIEINEKVSDKLKGINSRTNEKAESPINKKCEHCANEFVVSFNKRHQKFCSNDCKTLFKTITPPGVHPVTNYRQRMKYRGIEYKGGECLICGYKKCKRSLTFHHVDPNFKTHGIIGTSKSWDKIKKELDKCVLLCSNCHGEVHDGLIDLTKYILT